MTSRPSRSASSATIVERLLRRLGVGDDAFPQRGDVAADRGQRRAQLVGDGHQEVALELLGLREPRGHLAEPVGQVADLATARHVRHLDVVVSLRDAVGGVRQRQHRPRDPAGEVEGERADDDEADEERDRQPREQRQPGLAQLGLRLRDDQIAEDGAALAAEPDRIRRGQVRPVLAGRLELEGHDPLAAQLDTDVRRGQARSGRESSPGRESAMPT